MSDRMTMEKLMEIGDDACVQIAARPTYLSGNERLEPRLWDALRLELQKRYRKATGEEFAVLIIDHNPC